MFLIVNLVSDSYGQRSQRFFRDDYNYIEAVEGFYKVHTISQKWAEAKRICALEGTVLWHPDGDFEAQALLSFWKQNYPKITWMYLGISDLLIEGVFQTIEGKPLTQVYSTWELNEPNNAGGDEDCVHIDKQGYMNDCECDAKYNYICKKSLTSLEWNQECNMPNLDYVFSKDTGRCFKVHTTPLTWVEASAMCEVEHTSLAMITSRLEAYHLVKLTESTRSPKILENYQRGIYHLGFHNKLGEGWQTLTGKPIDVDDDVWYDNYQPVGRQQCGSMFYTGRLVNIDCERKCFFICEHKIRTNSPQLRVSSPELPGLVPYVSGGI
ncbi:hypothetical protein PYW07_003787 [Mythimna separata]|nr:hypothetical protein PYW07_003787 [Mythimna separata]